MNCYVHVEKEAVGTCVGCGKFICQECNTEINEKNYCKKCVNNLHTETMRKLEKLEDNKQPMVFMNAGGGGSSSSSASSSSSGGNNSLVPLKNKVLAGVLGIFLGGIGAHKFYLGKPFQGLLYLALCWTGIPEVLGVIEGIMYLVSSDPSFASKYGARVV